MYKELQQVWEELTAPGEMFEVTTVDVRGHELKVFANATNSLRDIWATSAGHADKDYLVYQDQRWTYAQAHADVNAIAAWLVANGVRQHDRVAIAMRNYPEWILAYWAVVSMGAVVVAINAWWVTEELEYGLKDCSPKVFIGDRERVERLIPVIGEFPDMKVVAVRCDGGQHSRLVPWTEVIAAAGGIPQADIDPDDDACIFYTSGTTGHPKGAQLTHRGFVNNLFSLMFIRTAQSAALVRAGKLEQPEGATLDLQPSAIITTPLFHVTANQGVLSTTAGGGKVVVMYKWDAGEALRIIEEEKISSFSGVPVMARELISHPDFQTRDTSSLAALAGGGSKFPPDLVEKIQRSEDVPAPTQGYGMTEIHGMISFIGADYFADKPNSAGKVLPTYEVKCINEEGNALNFGERGEICVRGVQVFKGYLNRPEATAESIVDGWLHTGDIGYLDEGGFLYVVDRIKEMVLRGGENVYCAEVEAVLYHHDAIAECVVFSVPDERLGEEVGAAIYCNSGNTVTADELRGYCKDRLAAYKIPRYIWIVEQQLPRNASGKFVKRELQQSLDIANAG
jgi:long-chain acyl-CoA synthetase